MAAAEELTQTVSCRVDVVSREVDAGHDLTIRATVVASPVGDLRGTGLQIEDRNGSVVENIELSEFDGEVNHTGDVVVKAPHTPGEHMWRAVYPAPTDTAAESSGAEAPFSFVVKPHTTRVVVWDVPPAVEGHERFHVHLGVTCASECQTQGWSVAVHDHDGRSQATATLGDAPWPGTTALYSTQVELTAPATSGLYAWEARVPAHGREIPHADGAVGFGVRVVPAPACRLTVVALDAVHHTPVRGAKVAVHPYRALTDERGVAEIRLPRGAYRLFVSGQNYAPFRHDGDMQADVTIAAELALDRGLSDADIWS